MERNKWRNQFKVATELMSLAPLSLQAAAAQSDDKPQDIAASDTDADADVITVLGTRRDVRDTGKTAC